MSKNTALKRGAPNGCYHANASTSSTWPSTITAWVANAGLILPVTLAHHLGLGELVDCRVDLGHVPGRANAGDKLLTLVASALAGGDCIDGADALRTGRTAAAIGCVTKASSTLGTFLRSFQWRHARQLARAWGAQVRATSR